MGYNFTIGEAQINYEPEDEWVCISAEGLHREDAPAFGEPTDHTSQRWPSYTAWSNFCRDANLYDLFYHDGGSLIGGHPGAIPISERMQKRVKASRISMEKMYPDIVAEYDEDKEYQGTYCRLLWLEYWIDYCLENCEKPVIANT